MIFAHNVVSDMEFSHRQRSNTAQRLEKMDIERKKAAKVKHVKWEYNPNAVTSMDQSELFQRKNFRRKGPLKKGHSLLSEQLVKCPNLPQNPFKDYAIFDGNVCSYKNINFKFSTYLAIFALYNPFGNLFIGTCGHPCEEI